MKKISVRDLCEITIIAALYVALTVGLTPLSYGSVQFRFSEVLMLMVLYKKKYAISLVLGCFIANLFSPVGWVDIVFGTLATVAAVIPMLFVKNKEISSLFPSIANGIIVGLELSIVYDLPIILTMAQVLVGEFVVVTLVGIPLFRALDSNKGFLKAIGCEDFESHDKVYLNTANSLGLALFIFSLICFFKLSLYNFSADENTTKYYTLFYRLKHFDYYFGLSLLFIPLLTFLSTILLSNKLGLVVDILLAISFLACFVYICNDYHRNPRASFYLYLLVPAFQLLISSIKYYLNFKQTKSNQLDTNNTNSN